MFGKRNKILYFKIKNLIMEKDKIEFDLTDVRVPLTKEEYKKRLSQLKIERDEEKWNVFEIGKWGIVVGNKECYQIEDKGCCKGVRMYMDHTAHDFNKETYCLFLRIDTMKFFYANIVLAPELGPHQTKFLPIPLSEVPMDLLLDFVYPYPIAFE